MGGAPIFISQPMAHRIKLKEKTLQKWNKDLLELHKKVITSYLVSQDIKSSVRRKFFKLYDMYIDESNIKSYFYTPLRILVYGLILNKMDQVSTYISQNNGKKKRRRNKRTDTPDKR